MPHRPFLASSCFPLPEAWHDKGEAKITKELIESIRDNGGYKQATATTKKLWEVICLDVFPSVVPAYKGKVQRQTKVSSVVTMAQEALVLWFLQVCCEGWIEEWAEEKKAEDEEKAKPRRTKPKGANFATQHADLFLHIQERVTTRREVPQRVNDWDNPILEAAKERAKAPTDGGDGNGGAEQNPPPGKRRKIIFKIVDEINWQWRFQITSGRNKISC